MLAAQPSQTLALPRASSANSRMGYVAPFFAGFFLEAVSLSTAL
jgi:hypothetical protein